MKYKVYWEKETFTGHIKFENYEMLFSVEDAAKVFLFSSVDAFAAKHPILEKIFNPFEDLMVYYADKALLRIGMYEVPDTYDNDRHAFERWCKGETE